MRSSPELSSVVACLVGFLQLISLINVIIYIMVRLLRAQQACVCQDFGSANDVRPCTQPCTASSFLHSPGFSINPLATKPITQLCKIYEDGLHDGKCMKDAVQDLGVVTLDQQFVQKCAWQHCYPGYENPALCRAFLYFPTGSTFHPVGMQRRLVPTSGDRITRTRMYLYHASGYIHYAKLVHLYHLQMFTLQDMDKDEFHSYTEEGFLTI